MLSRLSFLVIVIISLGCASLGKPSAVPGSPERCASLDDSAGAYGAISVTTGVLSGTAGLVTIPADKGEYRTALGTGAVISAAIAAGAAFMAHDKASEYVKEGCGK